MSRAIIRLSRKLSSDTARKLARLAGQFSSKVSLSDDRKWVDGKNETAMLALETEKDGELVLEVTGRDERRMLKALTRLLETEGAAVIGGSGLLSEEVVEPEPVSKQELDRAWTRFEARWRSTGAPEALPRPSQVVRDRLKRIARELACTLDQARRRFARKTRIPIREVRRIEQGEFPTYDQLRRIKEAFELTFFFLLGIDEKRFLRKKTAYFKCLGLDNPSREQQEEFEELYSHVLKQRLERKQRTGKEAEGNAGG